MEELAALGGLILGNTGGAVGAPVVHQPVYNHDSPAPPVYSHAEQSATDALFTAEAKTTQATSEEQPPLPVAAMVVSAAVVNLKAIVIDEARKETEEDEEEEERPANPRLGDSFEE